MTYYKFVFTQWLKYSLQSECGNFNQWEESNLQQVTWFITQLTDKSGHSLMSSNHFQWEGRCLVQLSYPRMDQAFLWKLQAWRSMVWVEKLFLYKWLDVPGHPFVVPFQRGKYLVVDVGLPMYDVATDCIAAYVHYQWVIYIIIYTFYFFDIHYR